MKKVSNNSTYLVTKKVNNLWPTYTKMGIQCCGFTQYDIYYTLLSSMITNSLRQYINDKIC
jgi:hypothetical protein